MQLLDFSMPSDAKAEILANCFLKIAHARQPEFLEVRRLWSNEFELAVDGEKLLIPRVIPNDGLNARYNASKRIVKKEVSLAFVAERLERL